MKIKVPSLNRKDSTGGGSTFIRNLEKALKPQGIQLVDSGDYDVLFIAGATLAEREEVFEAKKQGKKIVLRIDNILEDSRNRNTGMSRLSDFASIADVVIYQSEWAKRLLKPIAGDGVVIPNGVDTDIFYPNANGKNWAGNRILYSKHSRNETKHFHEVQYWWREYCIDNPDDTLVLVGNFADSYRQINNPFEFHNEEQFEYHPTKSPEELAKLMRTCDVAFLPYFADACPNTVIEAQACGLPVIYNKYGGTAEVVDFGCIIDYDYTPKEMVDFAIGDKKNYHPKDHKFKWGLETMGEKYTAVFKLLFIEEHNV